jgi:Domain of Unknown Function (DUF1206)
VGLKIAATSIDHEGEKEEEAWLRVTELGVAGFLSRGFVFAMIGLFLLFAAMHSRSNFAGALQVFQHQPHGSFLLGITAAGLLAFDVYGIAEGAYRRITPRRHLSRSNHTLRSP